MVFVSHLHCASHSRKPYCTPCTVQVCIVILSVFYSISCEYLSERHLSFDEVVTRCGLCFKLFQHTRQIPTKNDTRPLHRPTLSSADVPRCVGTSKRTDFVYAPRCFCASNSSRNLVSQFIVSPGSNSLPRLISPILFRLQLTSPF